MADGQRLMANLIAKAMTFWLIAKAMTMAGMVTAMANCRWPMLLSFFCVTAPLIRLLISANQVFVVIANATKQWLSIPLPRAEAMA